MTSKELAAVILSTLVEVTEPQPTGHLYAAVMGHSNLDTFNKVIDALKGAGLIEGAPGSMFLVVATDKARDLSWPPSVNVRRRTEAVPKP